MERCNLSGVCAVQEGMSNLNRHRVRFIAALLLGGILGVSAAEERPVGAQAGIGRFLLPSGFRARLGLTEEQRLLLPQISGLIFSLLAPLHWCLLHGGDAEWPATAVPGRRQ